MSYSTTKLFARDNVVASQLYKPSHIYLYTQQPITSHLKADPSLTTNHVTSKCWP